MNFQNKTFLDSLSNYLHKRRWVLSICLILLLWFIFCLPKPLFQDPSSTILIDRNEELLAARIADDGQWRFPQIESVPDKFEQCILHFEDQYFRYHPGINPIALLKAIYINIKSKKIVRGGSTITSQVIRLSRKGKKRTVFEKFIEFTQALRLELKLSKDEILSLYASHAPFGGNVVGLEAASWRYYGRSPQNLSWSESATLAVLPNAPGLIYPGKSHDKLLAKRNRLLDKLLDNNIIDTLTCELAKYESLPDRPKKLPQLTPHLLSRVIAEGHGGENVKVTIDKQIQLQSNRVVEKYHALLKQAEVNNACAIVIDVKTGNVLAYVGNTSSNSENDGNYVDIITSLRSSGSTLKPFLYARMQKEGVILPHSLVADVPTQISGFNPKNFNKRYDGAVPASNALARSLNIPAVRMLREYGLEKFHGLLPEVGIKTVNKNPNYYGLSIILGGAEVSLWELSSAYAGMARMLVYYTDNASEYLSNNYKASNFYFENRTKLKETLKETDVIGAGPAWITFEALTEMTRPLEGSNWDMYKSSKKIAWKTGTSFGQRDAWAVGITPGYVVGVWVGNADGEGRPGLTGTSTAAPLMFDIFKLLPETGWFETPYSDLQILNTCKKSGYKAGPNCPLVDSILVSTRGIRSKQCPYHKKVFLDKNKQFQVNSNCYNVDHMITESWFILPPLMEWYYKSHDPYYKILPPFHPNCQNSTDNNMELIYPQGETKIYIPKGFGGIRQKIVFEAAHRNPDATIHWHLNQEYVGSTIGDHQMEIDIKKGKHTLTLVSSEGETLMKIFEVLE